MSKERILVSLLAVIAVCLTANAQKDVKASKTLVAYFSATGTTAKVAEMVANVTGGELYAITPEKPYTSADLDWHDKQSRSSVEMNDPESRPALQGKKKDIADYDVIYLGYPIWWGIAPTIINTFIESHELKGKTVIPFATSGSSGIDKSVTALKRAYSDLNWKKGKLLNRTDVKTIREWVKEFGF